MAIPTKKRKAENLNGIPGRDADSTCIISSGTQLEGNLTSAESIRMDGVLVGDLSCQRKLVLGAKGRIEGNIRAREAVILGQIRGNVVVEGLLHLMEGAVIVGDIQASVLHVEKGAQLEGKSHMIQAEPG
jgi:cytoskeletal protein CcmA (bactofilin family)